MFYRLVLFLSSSLVGLSLLHLDATLGICKQVYIVHIKGVMLLLDNLDVISLVLLYLRIDFRHRRI